MAWTTADLLVTIRERGRLSDSQPTDAELCRMATHAMRTAILPLLRPLREQYGTVTDDVAMVSGQAEYEIPTRALNGALEELLYVDQNGRVRPLVHVPSDESWRFVETRSGLWPAPYAHTIRGGHIVVLPTPNEATDSIRIRFVERPSALRVTTRAAQVTSTTSTTIVVDGTGAFGAAATIDVDVRGQNPPFVPRALDLSAAWDGTDTFTIAATPSDVAVGDWVNLATESAVVALPETLHDVLGTAALVEVYQALGHESQRGQMRAQLGEELAAARQLLEPRTHDARPVFNRNSPLRRGGRR